MKIYIFVDLEGISGITSSEYVVPGGLHYQLGRKYCTMEVNACIRGCLKAGAESVIVRDGHGAGDSIFWDELDPAAELVKGASPGIRFVGIDECDAIILLGYHAMAGTPDAVLEHTFSSKTIQNMWVNERKAGEIGIDAIIAAEHGVPVIMVSGDDKACAEAKEWLPEAVTCQVKEGLSCGGARLMPMAAAHKLVEAKAFEAVKMIDKIPLCKKMSPVTLRREMVERIGVPTRSDARIIDARTYDITSATLEQALLC
jgi:D-amino peptidase